MINWVEEFKSWLNLEGKSLAEFSRQSNIPSSSLSDYLKGKTRMPEKRREIIYSMTGLEIFRNPVEQIRQDKEIPKIEEDRLSVAVRDLESQIDYLKRLVKRGDKKPIREEREESIRNAKKAFYALIKTLDYFKDCSDEEREQLTRAIDGRDVGYLTSFLDAIYKPDIFRTWVHFSNYRVRGKNG